MIRSNVNYSNITSVVDDAKNMLGHDLDMSKLIFITQPGFYYDRALDTLCDYGTHHITDLKSVPLIDNNIKTTLINFLKPLLDSSKRIVIQISELGICEIGTLYPVVDKEYNVSISDLFLKVKMTIISNDWDDKTSGELEITTESVNQ